MAYNFKRIAGIDSTWTEDFKVIIIFVSTIIINNTNPYKDLDDIVRRLGEDELPQPSLF